MSEALQSTQVSIQALETIFKAAFIRTEPIENEQLVVIDDDVRTVVRVTEDQGVISYMSLWSLNESSTMEAKLAKVNELNSEYILVRFSVSDPGTLWCGYQFLYEDGVTGFFIVNTLRYFARIVRAAVESIPEEMRA
jgi:hypothetical protein